MTNPLWAEKEEPEWYDGTLIEDLKGLVDEVREGKADIGTIMDGLEAAQGLGELLTNPFDALIAEGLGWAVEHFQPLNEKVNEILGDPPQLDAYARTWGNVTKAMKDGATATRSSSAKNLPSWKGKAGKAARAQTEAIAQGMDLLAETADVQRELTETGQKIVDWARGKIIDLAIDAVNKIKRTVAEMIATYFIPPLALVTVPAAEARIAKLAARYSAILARIMIWLSKLILAFTRAFKRLSEVLKKLQDLLDKLSAVPA